MPISPNQRGVWIKRSLIACVVVFGLYLLGFTLVVKMISGTKALAGPGFITMHPPLMHIHARNDFFKAIYLPLIRQGEALGWWEYDDDGHEYGYGHPMLFVIVGEYARR